jgi:glycine dehydrogenase subunit 2
MNEPLIFDISKPGRRAFAQAPLDEAAQNIPAEYLRDDVPTLPEVSELQVVRHYTRLSQQNFSIDTHFYPLGSCTMKYNPRACNSLVWGPSATARDFLPACTSCRRC